MQDNLREQIVFCRPPQPIRVIAGCDSSLIGDDIFSLFVLFRYPDLTEIEVSMSRSPLQLPYIPGLLSFREIPNLLKAWEKINTKPDIIMVDGHGIMHPRKMGIATHLGMMVSTPTIGVAKKRLYGTYDAPAMSQGAFSPVMAKSEKLGIALRSKEGKNVIFVSPGHLCDFETAETLVRDTLRGYKLPEPTRIADLYSKRYKSQIS